MTTAAQGIHDHPNYKLGRQPPKNAPALRLARILTGTSPTHPAAVDHFASVVFGLYSNDQFGDCGPTSVCNLVRLVSQALVGSRVEPSQRDCFVLYQQSGNPDFDPDNPIPGGPGDNGVDMQTMLEALLKNGIGDGRGGTVKPLAFAKVDVSSDAELDAAVSIFGGTLWGVLLQTAQQNQTDASPPRWDFEPTPTWGGHAIVDGKYTEATQNAEVISWDIDVQTTPTFRRNQLEEAWVVIWQWNVDHPAFQEGIDLTALKAAYKELTGRDLVVPDPTPPIPPPDPVVPPTPDPGPPPLPEPPSPLADAADRSLWDSVRHWSHGSHAGENAHAARAVREWSRHKNLS